MTTETEVSGLLERSEEERHILLHSLGLTYGDTIYRNHFVTGEGSVDYPHCMALVEAGLMTRRNGNVLTGGDDLFLVTEAGKQLALRARATKEPRK